MDLVYSTRRDGIEQPHIRNAKEIVQIHQRKREEVCENGGRNNTLGMRILILFDVIKIKYHMPICTYRKSLCSQSKFKTESRRLISDRCVMMIRMGCAVNEVAVNSITERVKE